MNRIMLCLVVALCSTAGCGKKENSDRLAKPMPADAVGGATKRREVQQDPFVAANAPEAKKAAASLPRKIKYTADITLIVADLGKSVIKLKEIIKSHKSEVAKSEESGSPGSVRQGTWRIRVPVDQFDAFREDVLKLGDVERNVTDSEDLTEEYYDVEKDIESKLKDEQRLQKILDKVADNVDKLGDNYNKVFDRLTDVQADINRKKGRLKLLANLTELTTVTVTLREKQKYDPDKPAEQKETPTFGQRAGRTFEDSLEGLANLGTSLVLILIALAPWLPFVAVVAVPGFIAIRRQTRQKQLLEEQREAARLAKKKRAGGTDALEIVEDGQAAKPPPPETPAPPPV